MATTTKLQIETLGRRSYVRGNTFPIRDLCREWGAVWDASAKAWWFSSSPRAHSFLDEAGEVLAQRAPAPIAPPSDRPSRHVGQVGEKLALRVTVVRRFEKPGHYGMTTIVGFRDEAGNDLTWFASGVRELQIGSVWDLSGTVKAHDVYQDRAQTTVTRCKLSEPTAAPVVEAIEAIELPPAPKPARKPRGRRTPLPALEGFDRFAFLDSLDVEI